MALGIEQLQVWDRVDAALKEVAQQSTEKAPFWVELHSDKIFIKAKSVSAAGQEVQASSKTTWVELHGAETNILMQRIVHVKESLQGLL